MKLLKDLCIFLSARCNLGTASKLNPLPRSQDELDKDWAHNVPDFCFGETKPGVVRPLPTNKPTPIPEGMTFEQLRPLLVIPGVESPRAQNRKMQEEWLVAAKAAVASLKPTKRAVKDTKQYLVSEKDDSTYEVTARKFQDGTISVELVAIGSSWTEPYRNSVRLRILVDRDGDFRIPRGELADIADAGEMRIALNILNIFSKNCFSKTEISEIIKQEV